MPDGDSDFSATGILTEPQFNFVLKSMQEKKGAEVIGDSQVTTLSGRQAQLFVPFNSVKTGNASSCNLTLDLLAACQTNSPEIQIELADGTINYFTGKPNPYGPAYGGDQRNLFLITNSPTILDGQTLVITRRLPAEWITTKTGQSLKESSLITFVTPTLIDAEGNRLSTGETTATNFQSSGSSNRFIGVFPDGGSSLLQVPSVAERPQ